MDCAIQNDLFRSGLSSWMDSLRYKMQGVQDGFSLHFLDEAATKQQLVDGLEHEFYDFP